MCPGLFYLRKPKTKHPQQQTLTRHLPAGKPASKREID
ncbi:hypothetical protein X474_06555 [Dethiosulfatarculus sandiegensis]|uniref:Uncharacterized protein n=1 Tax=Dethiosulfatarculus sandiegensis TaxID=1429043 RepID=A0A0D2JZ17_9BACT|nr:hypothetical protein X474_06555 [Dethiosulfatarculus sandiegensis]